MKRSTWQLTQCHGWKSRYSPSHFVEVSFLFLVTVIDPTWLAVVKAWMKNSLGPSWSWKVATKTGTPPLVPSLKLVRRCPWPATLYLATSQGPSMSTELWLCSRKQTSGFYTGTVDHMQKQRVLLLAFDIFKTPGPFLLKLWRDCSL